MTTFILLHGAFHGGWCWDLVAAELDRRGHTAIAPDLPIDHVGARWDDYVHAAAREVPASGDIVVVAHSLAGLVAPLVVDPVGARRLVLVAAFIPRPGRTMFELIEEDPSMMTPYPPEARHVRPDGSWEWTSVEAASERYYHDCADEIVDWASAQLRPQHWNVVSEPCPLTRWPEVDTTYIVCTADRAIPPEWSRRAARDWLGIEPTEIDSGHSPFLSRPAHLVDTLLDELEHRQT